MSMKILFLLLSLLFQPAPLPPRLVLLTPARVVPGEVFRVNAAIFGEGTYDMALRLGMPPGFTTDEELVKTVTVSKGWPAVLSWWVRAGQIEGRYSITLHTLGTNAIARTVVIGRDRVWLPMVENNEATPVFQTWLPMITH